MSQMHSNLFHIPRDPQTPFIAVQGSHVTALPLHLIALIISYLDDVTDLACVCRTSRVLNYMTLPQLYKSVTLTSRDERYNEYTGIDAAGSPSPFSTGLNTLVTRNVSPLVRSLHLQGQWKQYQAICRISDDAMMLNIAVRAALDRCTNLESFRWDLNTRLLQTVYGGLSSLRHLESLRLRFPSSRTPIKPLEIPPIPNLRSFTMTEYDPLCFPDDISTLLFHATDLTDVTMHFSPRMREAGEPSVHLTHFFRKLIAAKRRLSPRSIAFYNLYADSANNEIEVTHDVSRIERATFINTFGIDETGTPSDRDSSQQMSSAFDLSWRVPPKGVAENVRLHRYDRLNRDHAKTISQMTRLEKLYLVNARQGRQTASSSSTPVMGRTPSSNNGNSNSSSRSNQTHSSTPSTLTSSTNIPLRDTYLANISSIGSTLKHLVFPARWPLPTHQIGKLFRACPHLTQLSMSMDCSSFEGMRLLVPFLKQLWAFRLMAPENGDERMRENFDCLMREDGKHQELMGRELGREGEFERLRFVGLGERVWEVGGYIEDGDEHLVVDGGCGQKREGLVDGVIVNGLQTQRMNGTEDSECQEQEREGGRRLRKIWPVDLSVVRDVEIWKMDSLDVV